MVYKIGVMEGDGIGHEIVPAALKFLDEIGGFEIVKVEGGYEYFQRTGRPIEEGGLEILKKMDAILKGPMTTPEGPGTLKSVNVMLRQELDLYANVRPFRSFKGVSLKDLNFVIVREATEGLYVSAEGMFKDTAFSMRFVSRAGCERIVRFAFNLARAEGFKKVTCVHKANILKVADGFFREIFFDIAKEYPDIEHDELHVDAAAYYIVKDPKRFDVIVTLNLYGDILSDEAAGMVGSLGLCGAGLIGDSLALFEPVHGTVPKYAGKGIADPTSEISSLSLMLKYLGMKHEDKYMLNMSKILDNAIRNVVEGRKVLSYSLGGSATTEEVTNAILTEFRRLREST